MKLYVYVVFDVWYVLKMYHTKYNVMRTVTPRFMAHQVRDRIHGYEVVRVESKVINDVRWKVILWSSGWQEWMRMSTIERCIPKDQWWLTYETTSFLNRWFP